MTDKNILPQDLNDLIGSETKDFFVKAKRDVPKRESFRLIVLGSAVFIICFLLLSCVWLPIFQGREISIKMNGVLSVASFDNLGPLILPTIILVIFLIVGIYILIFGFYSMHSKGGYFIGTPTRLLHYRNGRAESIDWSNFSGIVTVKQDNIFLEMKSGQDKWRKNGTHRYVHDVLYICGVPNAFEIGEKCRKNIEKNEIAPSISDIV